MDIKIVRVVKPKGVNIILGQAHFIKTVEDMYEAIVGSVPDIKFGLAFCESSGACLVRSEGTDPELKQQASENALKIGAGHSFIVFIKNAYPINLLNTIKQVPEVCGIYCATANDVDVIITEIGYGRGILGVIDGLKPKGIEQQADIQWRKEFLRKIGYKL